MYATICAGYHRALFVSTGTVPEALSLILLYTEVDALMKRARLRDPQLGIISSSNMECHLTVHGLQ